MQTTTNPTTSAAASRQHEDAAPPAARTRRASVLMFARHYLEMVVAMVLGMIVLGAPLAALLGLVGVEVSSWDTDAPELLLLGMAFTMTVPMVAWMRHRGHGWAPTWEMAASMFVPSFGAIGLLWAGVQTDIHALLEIQHIAMLPSMLAVMLLRPREYAGHH